MSQHDVIVHWKIETESFAFQDYNREHDWIFSDKEQVRVSSAPQFLGNPDCADPEQGFVAALSSCHLLFFIAYCSKKRMQLLDYRDEAYGILEENDEGNMVISKVVLRPKAIFAEGQEPSREQLEKLHHSAHEKCFLANSIKSEMVIEF